MYHQNEGSMTGLLYSSFDVGMDMIGENVATLDLIDAVDGTVENLEARGRALFKANALASDITSFIRGVTCHLENEESMVEQLLNAEALLKASIEILARKRQHALDDPELRGHFEEAVVDAYDQLITISEETCVNCQALRWEILEHNADFDEVEDGFTTVCTPSSVVPH